MSDSMMMVEAPTLFAAVTQLRSGNRREGLLRNGVMANVDQLRKAGEILRDGPQPYCNGVASHMPCFIYAEDQSGRSLTIHVGILPSRRYRIDVLGRARELPTSTRTALPSPASSPKNLSREGTK